jgi:signal transduction histidine kinase
VLKTKRNLVRMVSHEIRTPLNSVVMGLDVLKEELLKSHCENEAMDTWTEVKSSCSIAVAILDELLLYEKLESGVMLLEKEKLSALTFLLKSVNQFRLPVGTPLHPRLCSPHTV